MGWAKMNTTQDVILSFYLKENTEKEINSKEADELNQLISVIITDTAEGNFHEIEGEFWDEGFDDNGVILDDKTEYSFIIRFNILVEGKYSYTPAILYLRNGDPGYPAEEDWDPQEGWIDSINKSELIKYLYALPYIGQLIDEDTVSVIVKDYDEDGEFEDNSEDEYWDRYDYEENRYSKYDD